MALTREDETHIHLPADLLQTDFSGVELLNPAPEVWDFDMLNALATENSNYLPTMDAVQLVATTDGVRHDQGAGSFHYDSNGVSFSGNSCGPSNHLPPPAAGWDTTTNAFITGVGSANYHPYADHGVAPNELFNPSNDAPFSNWPSNEAHLLIDNMHLPQPMHMGLSLSEDQSILPMAPSAWPADHLGTRPFNDLPEVMNNCTQFLTPGNEPVLEQSHNLQHWQVHNEPFIGGADVPYLERTVIEEDNLFALQPEQQVISVDQFEPSHLESHSIPLGTASENVIELPDRRRSPTAACKKRKQETTMHENSSVVASKRKKPRPGQGDPLPGMFCFSVDSDNPTVQQRARYSDSRKQEVARIRKARACWRCHFEKKPCSGGNPCDRCKTHFVIHNTTLSIFQPECVRTKISDVNPFTVVRDAQFAKLFIPLALSLNEPRPLPLLLTSQEWQQLAGEFGLMLEIIRYLPQLHVLNWKPKRNGGRDKWFVSLRQLQQPFCVALSRLDKLLTVRALQSMQSTQRRFLALILYYLVGIVDLVDFPPLVYDLGLGELPQEKAEQMVKLMFHFAELIARREGFHLPEAIEALDGNSGQYKQTKLRMLDWARSGNTG